MFDNLKEKFSKFTEEVDEEVDDEDTGSEPESKADGRAEEGDTNGKANAVSDGEDVTVGDQMRAAVSGDRVITEDSLEPALDELEVYLLQHDVEISVADEILEGVREHLVGEHRSGLDSTTVVAEQALADSIRDVLKSDEFDFDTYVNGAEKPVVIAFTGVNGVGKTTTIAKMARMLMDDGYSVVMANGDTFRAGANKQISQHAEALDVELITHDKGSDPAAVLYDAADYAEANGVDVVLCDTAGRLHTSDDLMSQLEKIERVVEPDLTFFVDEAIAGQDAIHRADEFNEAVDIDGTILTKADADAEGGAAISIAHVTGEPVVFIGNGQGYDDLVEFHPDVFVDHLFD